VKSSIPVPTAVIRPAEGWAPLDLKELWAYRELLYFMVWRDIKVRYKQTAMGVIWAVAQPVFTMVVFSVFFGSFIRVPSDGAPYPLFTYVALVPWMYFANAVTHAGNSLIDQERIISKVYFPRLILPLAAVLAGLLDFVIAFIVLVILLLWYGIIPSAAVLFLPFFILFAIVTAFSVGLWLSATNVLYRDVRYAIPFLVQFWLFTTPIAYPSSVVPTAWRTLYGLNPMTGVVEGFRWALLGNVPPPGLLMWVSVATVLALLITGLFYFRRMEQTFADVV